MHNVMTIAERERLAYLAGDTGMAQTLAELDDAQSELEVSETRVAELEGGAAK